MDHSFCEEHLLGLPEYYNSISSLFIIYFGIYGLMNLHNDLFTDILFASLAIVGVGSTGYHWYGNIGWALFDEMPMIITVFSGIIYADNVYLLTYNKKYNKEDSNDNLDLRLKNKENTIITPSANASGVQSLTGAFGFGSLQKNERKWNITQLYNKKGRLLVYLISMYIFMICNVMVNYRMIFPELFTGVVSFLYYKIYNLILLLEPSFQNQVKYKTFNSLLTIVISGIIWTFTEISCKYVNYHILLLGHPMWHFFIGHGFYNLIQIVYFIKLHNINNDTIQNDKIQNDKMITYNNIYLLKIHASTDTNIELI